VSDFWLHAMDDFGGADTAQPTQDILNGMAPQGATYPPAGGYRVVNRDPAKYAGMRNIKDFSARGAYDNSQPGQDVYEVLDDMGHSMWTGNHLPELPEHRMGREFFIRKNNLGLKVPYGWDRSMVEYAFTSAERTNAQIKDRQDDSAEMKARRAEASYLQHREGVAALRREAAVKAAVVPRPALDTPETEWKTFCRQSAIQTTERDAKFAQWVYARQRFISTGDDFWKGKMEASIVKDVDLYDDKAEADNDRDRKESAAEHQALELHTELSLLQKILAFVTFWRKSA
jgi:hypothetical protein